MEKFETLLGKVKYTTGQGIYIIPEALFSLDAMSLQAVSLHSKFEFVHCGLGPIKKQQLHPLRVSDFHDPLCKKTQRARFIVIIHMSYSQQSA